MESADADPMSRWKLETVMQRLCRYVTISPGCWIWTGDRMTSGYGRIWTPQPGNRHYKAPAHRVMYELFHGPIPPDLDMDHLCRNRACVNPDHLEPVTRRENLLRGATIPATKARQTHCIRGHAFTPTNTKIRPNGTRFCLRCYDLRQRQAN